MLGRLRQSVELPRMLPRGHQIIPRPLRRRRRQNGRSDLQKPMLRHRRPQGGDHVAPQNNVLLNLRIPQIEIPVLQPRGLVRLPAPVDLEGQLVVPAFPQYLDLLRHDFDFSGRQILIFAAPLPDSALHSDNGLLVQRVNGVHHLLGLNDHLRCPIEVPQDNEPQILPHFPEVLHPPGELHFLPHMLQPELIAGMRPVLCHDKHLSFYFCIIESQNYVLFSD